MSWDIDEAARLERAADRLAEAYDLDPEKLLIEYRTSTIAVPVDVLERLLHEAGY